MEFQTTYLEKEMATHSSILAWKIPWTEESGRLQSMESQDSGDLVTKPTLLLSSFESYVLQSVQAALRKKHRLGGLNNIKLFLTVLEYGESKIRVPLWFGSGASPLPDLLSLVLQKKCSGIFLLIWTLIPSGCLHPCPSIALQRPHIQIPSRWELLIQPVSFQGT